MYLKKNFKVGDVFTTWEVVKCIDSKSYKYLCVCNKCGAEKSFIKYNLLKGSYSLCKSCAPNSIKNINLIRFHWNTELNGISFTKPQDFNLERPYWFICDKFHNFKSSIKDFSLSRCRSCKEKELDSKNKIMIYTIAVKVLKAMFDIVEDDDCWILIPDLNFALHLIEKDKFSNFRKYFTSERAMLEYLKDNKNRATSYEKQGYTIKEFCLENDFKKDIDNFKKSVLYFNQLNESFRNLT